MTRRRIRAKERRRILLSKTFLHLSIIATLFLLAESGLFLGNSEKARGKTLEEQVVKESDRLPPETLPLVKYFEGYNPTCVDWLDGYATIGYGELLRFAPCTAEDNALRVSQKEATATLGRDLLFFKERVEELVQVPIDEKMKAALISFSYNVGDGGLADSTLLSLLNRGDYRSAAEQFDLWINGPSGPLPGLVKRRAMEKDLFLQGLSRLRKK